MIYVFCLISRLYSSRVLAGDEGVEVFGGVVDGVEGEF